MTKEKQNNNNIIQEIKELLAIWESTIEHRICLRLSAAMRAM